MLVVAGYWAMVGRNTFEFNQSHTATAWQRVLMAAAFGACLAVMAGGRDSPFLYFQF
jgi:hypothetical protein